MRPFFFTALFFMTSSAFAAHYPEKPHALVPYTVDFAKGDETITMNCDEAYEGIELTLPGDYTFMGELLVEGKILFQGCDAHWSLFEKLLVDKAGVRSTKVRLKGGPDCDLEIQSHDRPIKTFTLHVRSC